jgi:hypothetical protein
MIVRMEFILVGLFPTILLAGNPFQCILRTYTFTGPKYGRVTCGHTIHALTQPTGLSGRRAIFDYSLYKRPGGIPLGRFALKPEKRGDSERRIMLTQPVPVPHESHSSLQPQVIHALAHVRSEWEATADGTRLLYQVGSVGLILFDIVSKLNVPIEQQRLLLGSSLFDEITAFVTKQG